MDNLKSGKSTVVEIKQLKNPHMGERDWDINPILSTGAKFMVLLSRRQTGKSYTVKNMVFDKFLETGEKFCYVRRRNGEISTKNLNRYFKAEDFRNKNDVKFNGTLEDRTGFKAIIPYNGELFLGSRGLKGLQRGDTCGYYVAFENMGIDKSATMPSDVQWYLYEEFTIKYQIGSANYLPDEPNLFNHLNNTLTRDNPKARWFLIGNTESLVCPYFEEWGIENIDKMKEGEIDVYTFQQLNARGEVIEFKVAVEMVSSQWGQDTAVIGKASGLNIEGQSIDEYERFPYKVKDCTLIKEVMYICGRLQFNLQLWINNYNGTYFIYVCPPNHPILRVVTEGFSRDYNQTQGFSRKSKNEVRMVDLINTQQICGASDLLVTTFYQAIASRKLPLLI